MDKHPRISSSSNQTMESDVEEIPESEPTNVPQKPRVSFDNLKSSTKSFANFVGLPINGTMTPWLIFHMINNIFWHKLQFSFFGIQGIIEHKAGRRVLLADATFCCGLVIVFSPLYGILILIWKRQVFAELIEWCEKLYQKKPTEEFDDLFQQKFGRMVSITEKIVRVLHVATWAKWAFHLIASFLTAILADEALLPAPTYTVKGYVQEFPWYPILFVMHQMLVVYMHGNIRVLATTYVIASQHIEAQLEYLMEIIQTMKPRDKTINYVAELHADVITQIGKLSDLYNAFMLMTEATSTANFVLAGLMIVLQSEYHMILVVIVNLTVCALYSHFGQEISSRTEDVADAFYESCWLEMSHSDRHVMALLLMQVAQKQYGISAGGFHFISYQQFSDVSNFLNFVENEFS